LVEVTDAAVDEEIGAARLAAAVELSAWALEPQPATAQTRQSRTTRDGRGRAWRCRSMHS
jgi:hypothetical protein